MSEMINRNECCAPQRAETPETTHNAGWTYRPSVDVFEFEDRYELTADVPGAAKDAVALALEDGVLTLDAPARSRTPESASPVLTEYGVGRYHRRFRVGDDVDPERVGASLDDGVLTVTLPKAERSRARRIEIS